MRIHLIAIGGAIMHALALDLQAQGHKVTGSDDVIFDPAKSRLAAAGLLPEMLGWHSERISDELDLVILGMHAKADNPELLEAQRLGLKVQSFPEFVTQSAENQHRIVIAGSHGKTTTTAMVMHALAKSGLDFDYLVGSSLPNYDRMVRLSGNESKAPIIVIEGDEYFTSPLDLRPKFLHYKPHALCITGIAWDHANVFPTPEIYEHAFESLLESCSADATIAYFSGDMALTALVEGHRKALNPIGYHTPKHEVVEGKVVVDTPACGKVALSVFGEHNLQNMEAARLLCATVGVDAEAFWQSMQDFTGASRRMQLIPQSEGQLVINDFAHSPSKVAATVRAVVAHYAPKPITGLLELHTFSSLKPDFLPNYRGTTKGLSKLIVLVDEAVLQAKGNQSDQAFDASAVQDMFASIFEDPLTTVVTNQSQLLEALGDALSNIEGEGVLLIMSSGALTGLTPQEIADAWKKSTA